MAYDTTVFRSPSTWIAISASMIGLIGAMTQERNKSGSAAFDPDAQERHRWQRKESKRGARLPPTPCPSCVRRGEGRPNMLTSYEKARGYQCPDCTARDEGGGY